MKRQPWGLYAIALAIGVVGLVALGVDVSTLLLAALVLACPLMMLFMHGGHGGHSGHAATLATAQRPRFARKPQALSATATTRQPTRGSRAAKEGSR